MFELNAHNVGSVAARRWLTKGEGFCAVGKCTNRFWQHLENCGEKIEDSTVRSALK